MPYITRISACASNAGVFFSHVGKNTVLDCRVRTGSSVVKMGGGGFLPLLHSKLL